VEADVSLQAEERIVLRQRFYPEADARSFGIIQNALRQHLRQGARVLDAGSGTGTWILKPFARQLGLLVGADVVIPTASTPAAEDRLSRAPSRQRFLPVLADLADLPFPAGSFDLALCYDVIEHLPDPGAVFAELSRVLVTGGVLILQTPALFSPPILAARVLPLALHRLLKGGLEQAPERVFPTLYRCNTPAQLQRTLQAAGFRRELLLRTDQSYDYLYFARAAYTAGLLYSRVLAQPWLAWLRSSIVGVYVRA
jgi:SAM-dependent methyltransferase